MPSDAGPSEDLQGLIRRVDPDRWLTSRFIADPAARAAVVALYAFDHELARAPRVAQTSLLAEIRLTWWREVLDETFAGGAVRRHPVAEALAAAARRHGLPRTPLEAMIDGHIAALDLGVLDAAQAISWADAVQGSLATAAAAILDAATPADAAAPAGRAWGLALLLRSARSPAGLLRPQLVDAVGAARQAARGLSVAALPAALPARLARFDATGRSPGPASKQLALVWASLTGRI